VGSLGSFYHRRYVEGNRHSLNALVAEEENLLRAKTLAMSNGWWSALMNAMQGLHALYGHTARQEEWAALVGDVLPYFVDPHTDRWLPGRQHEWHLVMGYRVMVAMDRRDFLEAERLEELRNDWCRTNASSALAEPMDGFQESERLKIRALAISFERLGEIQRELGRSECAESYRQAFRLEELISDQPLQAICAFNLSRVHTDVPTLRDLNQAEEWCQESLALHEIRDHLGRSRCLSQLGQVAYERFKDARAAGRTQDVQRTRLQAAERLYLQALRLVPADALNDLATLQNQLGCVCGDAGELDVALAHYRESIRYCETIGNAHTAARTRFNVACDLHQARRLEDAQAYAQTALANFQEFGDRASAEIQKTQQLIALIQQAIAEQREGDDASP